MVKDRDGRCPGELGGAGLWNVILFSALTWLGDRKGIRPVKSWVLVCAGDDLTAMSCSFSCQRHLHHTYLQ